MEVVPSPARLEPLAARLETAVRRRPGQTASALATLVLGKAARASRVQFTLTLLELRGLIVRLGEGGRADPFRYFSNGNVEGLPRAEVQKLDGGLLQTTPRGTMRPVDIEEVIA